MDWPEEQNEMGRIMMRDAAISRAQGSLNENILALTIALRTLTEVVQAILTRLEALENAGGQSGNVVRDHGEEDRDRENDDPQRRD